MSTPPTKPVKSLVLPSTLRTKVSLKRCSLVNLSASLVARDFNVLSYAWKCFINERLRLTSLNRHILVYFYLFSLWRHKMKLGFSFARYCSTYLKFFRRWTWPYNYWWISTSLLNFLDLHLFYCKRSWFVHRVLTNWNMPLSCPLVEITLAVRACYICKHGASGVNI